ncbi:MAG: hypothetical protein QM755_08215 [Luteolibacter sp.]
MFFITIQPTINAAAARIAEITIFAWAPIFFFGLGGSGVTTWGRVCTCPVAAGAVSDVGRGVNAGPRSIRRLKRLWGRLGGHGGLHRTRCHGWPAGGRTGPGRGGHIRPVIAQENLERLTGIRGTIARLAVDVPHYPVPHPLRQIRAHIADRLHQMIQMGPHHLGAGLAIKGIFPRQGEVVDAPHRIQVGAAIHEAALELLGRHEENRTIDRILLVEGLFGGLRRELGEAEVHDLHLELPGGQPGQHQVPRLDIAVDDMEILRSDEGLLRLDGHFTEIPEGQRSLLHQFVQGLAGEHLHHHIGTILIRAHVIDRHDVRMLQGCECSGLLGELLGGLVLVVGITALGDDPLDGHLPVHALVERAVDRTDPTLADFPAYFVTFVHVNLTVSKPCPFAGGGGNPEKRFNPNVDTTLSFE